jgi:quercetin dioxygenase-like cupin family protein
MRFTYPHTIENGSGEEITFVRLIENEAGGMLEVTNRVQPGGGPPMHVHFLQDESLTVIQGKIGAQVAGQAPTFCGPGQTVTFTRGEVHRFWNAGDEELLCHGWVKPAHNFEYFLTEVYRSIKANGGHKPGAFDAAYLMSRYRTEFEMNEIPGFVKKVIFPITLFLGKIMGKYQKYSGSPTPVNF